MINDLPKLYFDNLSGVRMNTMLNYINTSEETKKDSEIVASHTKFVNSVCYCLFGFKGGNSQEESIVQMDMERIANNINGSIKHLISGNINT